MAKTRVKDDSFNMVVTWTDPPSATGSSMCSILTSIERLHTIVPIVNYEVDRAGSTDNWEITAETVNGRTYHSTVSINEDGPTFSHTTFPESKAKEIESFFNLELTWTNYLKIHSVEKVNITWS